MKNKEIEELLNNFQEILDNPTTTDEGCDGRIIKIDRYYDLEQDEIKILLSHIEQLEKRNESLLEDRRELLHLVRQLENNRDKAIELIEKELKYPPK